MKITEEMVDYISTLARLRLPPEEKGAMAGELKKILDCMDSLNALDTEQVEPLSHELSVHNVVRPDEVEPSADRALLLQNAPVPDRAAFLVPKTVE